MVIFACSSRSPATQGVERWSPTDGSEIVQIWTIFSGEIEARSLCFALLPVSAPAAELKIHESSSLFSFTEKNMIYLCATKGQKS
ncbi:hypothetical protein MRB53_033719 [Persea americana]|uniref:Uncharacterized protein n=1 Tax=Persea americana TaxID=3435 RepID=A0ACC2KVH2_PERAE|nr:hypothetical protein MRB53_033719 [Persea americana]